IKPKREQIQNPKSKIQNLIGQDPVLMLYLLGLVMAAAVVILSPNMFDRYWLPVLPVLIIAALHARVGGEEPTPNTQHPTPVWWRWLLLAPLALFSIVAQHDYMAHAAARWQGAETLVAQGAHRDQISAGFEWSGWYLFDEGARRVREKPLAKYIPFPPETVLDPVFAVSDVPLDGYSQ